MTRAEAAPHVVVVGGGLAGLAAALECLDRGATVTLTERRNRLGGLTWSFEHGGLSVDNGQHVFLRCCTEYLAWLERIGSRADVQIQDRLDIPVLSPDPRRGGMVRTARLRRNDLPAPLHLAGSLMRFPYLSVVDRVKLGPAVALLRRMDLDDPKLDQISFGEWLGGHGQSDRAIAAVWDLITVPTVNLRCSEASLAMGAKVFQTGLLTANSAADIGWSRVPLGLLHGERAESALLHGGAKLVTGTRVEAIRLASAPLSDSDDQPAFEVRADGTTMGADAVIVALPHDETAHVLPPGAIHHQDRLEELGFSAVVDVHLVMDRRVSPHPLLAAVDSPLQWVFDRTSSSGLEGEGQYLAVSLSSADSQLSRHPEDIVSWAIAELVRILPGARDARVIDSLVTKERRATFRAAPGSGSLRPGPQTAIPGLAVAGAWTATGWPATMEGAVRSGQAAAAAVVAHLSRRLRNTVPTTATKEEVA